MNRSLLKVMQNDLGITAYIGEKDYSLATRVLYSACAEWMRYFMLDQDENGEAYPKTKRYLLSRGRESIVRLIDSFPETRAWFVAEGEDWPYVSFIKDLRELMVDAGELLADNEGNLHLPEFLQKPAGESLCRIRGIKGDIKNKNDKEQHAGITRICSYAEKIKEAEPFFPLEIDSRKFSVDIFKSANYGECLDMGRYEFFNPHSHKALYQSWENSPGKGMDLALGRIKIINGMYEYYLFRRNSHGEWDNSRLSDFLVKRREYRRIMLAQRMDAGKPMSATFKNFGNVMLLKLYCFMPWQQETQVRTYGWPVKSYDDRLNYYIPLSAWPVIEKVCGELCIELQGSITNE